MEGPRKWYTAMMAGLDIRYDLGAGHALIGRRMPDLELVTNNGPVRVYELMHKAQPLLLNIGAPAGLDASPVHHRVQLIEAACDGAWELPAIGLVEAPTAVLVRPDGYVAWVGQGNCIGLDDALDAWAGGEFR